MKKVLLFLFFLFYSYSEVIAGGIYISNSNSNRSSRSNDSSLYSGNNNMNHQGKTAIKNDRRFKENAKDEELYILNEYRMGLEAQMNNNRVPANPNDPNYGERVRRQALLQYEYDQVNERMHDVMKDKNRRGSRGR